MSCFIHLSLYLVTPIQAGPSHTYLVGSVRVTEIISITYERTQISPSEINNKMLTSYTWSTIPPRYCIITKTLVLHPQHEGNASGGIPHRSPVPSTTITVILLGITNPFENHDKSYVKMQMNT